MRTNKTAFKAESCYRRLVEKHTKETLARTSKNAFKAAYRLHRLMDRIRTSPNQYRWLTDVTAELERHTPSEMAMRAGLSAVRMRDGATWFRGFAEHALYESWLLEELAHKADFGEGCPF